MDEISEFMSRAARLPYGAALGIYHALVPYDRRIILWSYRQRKAQEIRERVESLDRELIQRCRVELSEIIAQHPTTKGVVIFAPSADWDVPLFQRPHQMAIAFASIGFLVLYWIRPSKRSLGTRFRTVMNGLYICDVPASAFSEITKPIVVSYTHNYQWVRLLRNSPTIIYELIDHLDIFSTYSRRGLLSSHKKLLRQAAVVVGTADNLVSELQAYRPDALLCPNGVDLDHFAPRSDTVTPIPEDMHEIFGQGKPIIGYYGALAEWFDFELLKYAARSTPEYNFVLIGPDYDGRRIAASGIDGIPNIYWLGPKPYSELPLYLRLFDVATIPFVVSEALHAVSPIKLFEYMAGGKPVVTTDLAECRKYPVVLIARTRDEWVSCLRQALELRNDDPYLARVRQTAEANTWVARARQLASALEREGHPHADRHGSLAAHESLSLSNRSIIS